MSVDDRRPSRFLPPAGGIELPGRARLRLTGRDRAAFLHNFCTNDIKRLAPGQACEAFITNVKGRIAGHVHVIADAESLILDSVPGSEAFLAKHLDRYLITEDVQIADETANVAVFHVFGPAAETWLASKVVGIVGWPVAVHRADFTASPGFEVAVAKADRPALIEILNAGGIAPVNASDFEAWRIDAGFPWHGVDLSEENLAQEAGRTSTAISFTKGCYLGQEPIARIDALGHVNRILRIIAFDADTSPEVGGMVRDAASDQELGTLASVGRTSQSTAVGLAVLKTAAVPGTAVVAGDARATGRVVAIE